ncbi:class A beta-lactamase-related serine hydrolase [bacterium]|nr:MAG: class A beta-lactamase-related serine hydrolase [bacterium]
MAKLSEVQAAHKVPAISASMVVGKEILSTATVGNRVAGKDLPVHPGDRFQIGSVMKVMTGTLVGRMVDRGEIRWDTTLREMFPELSASMRPEYSEVTVDQLLSHMSGMPYQPSTPEGETDAAGGESLVARRYEYTKAALRDAPEAPPGTKQIYGGGPILVANYLERKLGCPYEVLIAEEVFKPLGMARSGFGNTSSLGRVDGPWEHAWEGNSLQPVAPFSSFEAESRSCVGRNGYSTAEDTARFLRVHLERRSDFLKPETWAHLQTAVSGSSHGPGWVVTPEAWCGKNVLWHNGSNGKNLALLMVCRDRKVGWSIMVNAEGPEANAAYRELEQAFSTYLGEKGH